MTFIPMPASCAWLQTADPHIVRLEHFQQCCTDYMDWKRAQGVNPHEFVQTAEEYVNGGDLQDYIDNVVNWWPKDAPDRFRMPTLYRMMTHVLDTDGRTRTFLNVGADYIEAVAAWMVGAGKDPSNPNETAAEKEARKNRERVARWRVRHANDETKDEGLNVLVRAAKAAELSVSQGRKWIKGELKTAKSDMDAAILAAKAERVARCQRAEDALAVAVQAAMDAQDAVRRYKGSE